MWEKDVNINQVSEIRTRTTVFFGIGEIEKIDFSISLTFLPPVKSPAANKYKRIWFTASSQSKVAVLKAIKK